MKTRKLVRSAPGSINKERMGKGNERTQTAQKILVLFTGVCMVFTTAVGNIGPVVMAADDDTFVEVTASKRRF